MLNVQKIHKYRKKLTFLKLKKKGAAKFVPNFRQNSETNKTPHRHGNRTNKLMLNVHKYRKKLTILKLRRKKGVTKFVLNVRQNSETKKMSPKVEKL